MPMMGERGQRKGVRSLRVAALMLLALGLLLALAPVLTSHRTDASGGAVVTAALDAYPVGLEATAYPDHGNIACHGGPGCPVAATLPDGQILAVPVSGRQHFGAGPSTWLARPVRPDIKPPIL